MVFAFINLHFDDMKSDTVNMLLQTFKHVNDMGSNPEIVKLSTQKRSDTLEASFFFSFLFVVEITTYQCEFTMQYRIAKGYNMIYKLISDTSDEQTILNSNRSLACKTTFVEKCKMYV